MRKIRLLAAVLGLIAAVAASLVFAQGFKNLKGVLTGFEEVPVVSTTGRGEFRARISNDETQISYELSYEDLQGSVTQAHIHLGQMGVNGGISVWLCGNPSATIMPPPGTQACPPSPATISGIITAQDVVGPTGQGIAPGEFDELIRAIRAGKTYANVHSTMFPGGEIRNQLDPSRDPHGGRGGH